MSQWFSRIGFKKEKGQKYKAEKREALLNEGTMGSIERMRVTVISVQFCLRQSSCFNLKNNQTQISSSLPETSLIKTNQYF